MHPELERNMPGHPDWEGSFYERLSEHGEWSIKSFRLLYLELINTAENVDHDLPVNRGFVEMLIILQQKILDLISAHFAENDVFKIENISSDQIYHFKELFELAIIGSISGKIHGKSPF